MASRTRLYLLLGALAVCAALLYYGRSESPSQPSVLSADTRFQPLNVKEPELRIDLLQRMQKAEYNGSRRNIFVSGAAPASSVAPAPRAPKPVVGPSVPPPPPPVQVPAEFFGYESAGTGGKRVAFFKNGADVLVLSEGETFLSRFRLVKIGADSADVEEISSGRHATVPLVQPPAGAPN